MQWSCTMDIWQLKLSTVINEITDLKLAVCQLR